MGRDDSGLCLILFRGGGALALVVASGCPMPNPAWKDSATVASTPGTSDDPSTSASSESASESASSTSDASTTMGVVSETGTGTGTTGVTSSSGTTQNTTMDPTEDTDSTGGVVCEYSEMLVIDHMVEVGVYQKPVSGCDENPQFFMRQGEFSLVDDQTLKIVGAIPCPGLAEGESISISGSWPIPPSPPPGDGCGRLLLHYGGPQCDFVGFQILVRDKYDSPFYAASISPDPLEHPSVVNVSPVLDGSLGTTCETGIACANENGPTAAVYFMKWMAELAAVGVPVAQGAETFLNVASHRRLDGADCVRESAWIYKRTE